MWENRQEQEQDQIVFTFTFVFFLLQHILHLASSKQLVDAFLKLVWPKMVKNFGNNPTWTTRTMKLYKLNHFNSPWY